MGGLPRRNTVLADARAQGPVVVVEAGGSLAPRILRKGDDLEQRKIKAELVAEAWRLAGVDAVALAASDWALGAVFVRDLVAAKELPLLAGNLTCGDTTFPGHRLVRHGSATVGIVGVTAGSVDGCTVGEARPALERAVAAVGDADVVVALLPVDDDAAVRALLEPALAIDVAIDARGRAPTAPPARLGNTWTVGTGTRARSVGRLTLALDPTAQGWVPAGLADRLRKQQDTLRTRLAQVEARLAGPSVDEASRRRLEDQRAGYTRQIAELDADVAAHEGARSRLFATAAIDLGEDVADHPETAAAVAAAKDRIRTSASDGGDPSRFVPRIVSAGPYAGGEVCAGCHAAEHAQWSTTAHARAWSTLVTEDRALDADCWTCHVTGAAADGGPPSATASGGWRDVQCEACHGPSRAHAAAPATVDSVASPPVETCTVCHDGEQDGGRFDASTYLPEVRHR